MIIRLGYCPPNPGPRSKINNKWNTETKTLEKLPKFKDGDIIYFIDEHNIEYISILKYTTDSYAKTYADFIVNPGCTLGTTFYIDKIKYQRLATDEEKQKLFDAVKAKGYRWNTETKTLEKLVESNTPKKFYIRIGDIPSEEKSAVYNGDAVIGYEEGVSVYDCVETDGLYHIVMPFPLKEGQGMTYECLIQEITQCRYNIKNPRNVYLVSGIEVGKGHDNEPLIKEVKILKDLTGQFKTKTDNTEETKNLEKLIEPKFKVGDRIKMKGIDDVYAMEITEVTQTIYTFKNGSQWGIESVDKDYELVPNKFDINTLKPFESRVLVRDYNDDIWRPAIFGAIVTETNYNDLPFVVVGGSFYDQCIPYKGNEHLSGKTDDCNEYFKNW